MQPRLMPCSRLILPSFITGPLPWRRYRNSIHRSRFYLARDIFIGHCLICKSVELHKNISFNSSERFSIIALILMSESPDTTHPRCDFRRLYVIIEPTVNGGVINEAGGEFLSLKLIMIMTDKSSSEDKWQAQSHHSLMLSTWLVSPDTDYSETSLETWGMVRGRGGAQVTQVTISVCVSNASGLDVKLHLY